MEPAAADDGFTLSAHRIEALSDGIYAVAMTLLVIDLKLPEGSVLRSTDDVARALMVLAPRFEAWLVSFLVLALFWYGNHRLLAHLRRIDGRTVALNLAQLALVSLMPFACALNGQYAGTAVQVVYAATMSALSLLALLLLRHVHRHPDLTVHPVSDAEYTGGLLRTGGLVVVALLAVALAWAGEGSGNLAYLLMAFITPMSRRVERRRAAH
ncbi:MAG: DUF1211 domain-containing protein [Proteobacteria bacterium]|nr:DUF1211 domain-containing protein [Pseudomonadota bacterium]